MSGFFSRLFGKTGGGASFDTVDAATLRDWLGSRDDITLVDVRGADEFVGPLGHIAGARNLPLGELPARLAELAPLRERTLVLACLTDRRSGEACRQLVAAGFPRVVLLGGGMRGWHARGFAVEGASAS